MTTVMSLREIEQLANDKLVKKGKLSLNEVYEMLGLKKTERERLSYGAIVLMIRKKRVIEVLDA